MKVWIDKHGGMHYHKADCKFISEVGNNPNLPHFKYEEVEHAVRHSGSGFPFDYTSIKVDDRWYFPCPFCFGKRRGEK